MVAKNVPSLARETRPNLRVFFPIPAGFAVIHRSIFIRPQHDQRTLFYTQPIHAVFALSASKHGRKMLRKSEKEP